MKIERINTSFELTAAELEAAYSKRHMQYLAENFTILTMEKRKYHEQ